MIKDPWEFKWSCPDPDWKHKRFYCPYSERYALPCGTKRSECDTCYMKQQSLTDRFNWTAHYLKKPKVVHICDRCGAEIGRIDLAVYMDITNRDGVTILTQELCFDCASTLVEWAQKKGEDD